MNYSINTYLNNKDNTARFALGFDSHNPLFVIGVNPSTADDNKPDATIRRVIGYAKLNNFDGFIMLNVYPQRATNPNNLDKECNKDLHIINIEHIKLIISKHANATILVAFGNAIEKRAYLIPCFNDIIDSLINYNIKWVQIGSPTKEGNPRHPSRGAYQNLKEFNILTYKNTHSLLSH